MARFLNGFLPRFLPGTANFEVIVFKGKPDLLKKLGNRLAGLSKRSLPGERIFVLVDRDSDDCYELKAKLDKKAEQAGLVTRTASGGGPWQIFNRIVIEELEAWYFGDWTAVRAAYPKGPKDPSKRAGFRDPDGVKGGTSEAFERVMKREFPTGLSKPEAAHKISKHIDPDRSNSSSFRVFWEAVLEAVA